MYFLLFCCCWRDDVIVFVLIFEFLSDSVDFRVFRLVVVLEARWGFGCDADWKVSFMSVSVWKNRGW